jgi:uncharacterized protein YecT (DUF1311 family)
MIATLLLALTLQASTDTQAPEPRCPDAQTQLDMNFCAERDFERADAELNRVYRQAIDGARQDDGGISAGDHRPTAQAVLREAQRAWVTFRDAQCTFEGYAEARGGSMEPMVEALCRARLTRERTAQLRPQPNER